MFFEIGVLKNFANFTGKHPYWKRLQHRCFPVNITRLLRTAFCIKQIFFIVFIWWLLLNRFSNIVLRQQRCIRDLSNIYDKAFCNKNIDYAWLQQQNLLKQWCKQNSKLKVAKIIRKVIACFGGILLRLFLK